MKNVSATVRACYTAILIAVITAIAMADRLAIAMLLSLGRFRHYIAAQETLAVAAASNGE